MKVMEWTYEVSHQVLASSRVPIADMLAMEPPGVVYGRTRDGGLYAADPPWAVIGVSAGGAHSDPLRQVERVVLHSPHLRYLKPGSKEHRLAATLWVAPQGTALPANVGRIRDTKTIPTPIQRCQGGIHADWVLRGDTMRCNVCGVGIKEAFRSVPFPRPPTAVRPVQQAIDKLNATIISRQSAMKVAGMTPSEVIRGLIEDINKKEVK